MACVTGHLTPLRHVPPHSATSAHTGHPRTFPPHTIPRTGHPPSHKSVVKTLKKGFRGALDEVWSKRRKDEFMKQYRDEIPRGFVLFLRKVMKPKQAKDPEVDRRTSRRKSHAQQGSEPGARSSRCELQTQGSTPCRLDIRAITDLSRAEVTVAGLPTLSQSGVGCEA